MATCLSALTRLESLNLELDFPRFPTNGGSRHDLPPPTRTVFPALTEFRFQGKNACLEDLIVRIEAPNQQTRYSVCHGSRAGGLQYFATRQVHLSHRKVKSTQPSRNNVFRFVDSDHYQLWLASLPALLDSNVRKDRSTSFADGACVQPALVSRLSGGRAPPGPSRMLVGTQTNLNCKGT